MDEGIPCVAISHHSLPWAVDLLAARGVDRLRNLKVKSGEHLAAILTTAFFGVAPEEIDEAGGVDLLFRFQPSQRDCLLGDREFAAFEVKSLPGQFRALSARWDRVAEGGGDARGSGFSLRTQSPEQVVVDARPSLVVAQTQLANKAKAVTDCSHNAFIVVHPFDRLAVGPDGTPFAALLPPLEGFSGLDSVWVLWFPDSLTVWSRATQTWAQYIFTAMGKDELNDEGDETLSPLQKAECRLLDIVGYVGGSPYLFAVSS